MTQASGAGSIRTPSGFVVNADRNPKPTYLILHRALCNTISPTPDKAWTRDYIKICSARIYELEEWAREVGGSLSHCAFCEP